MPGLQLIATTVGIVSIISGLVVTWLYTTRKHRLEIERLEKQRQNEEQASPLHKPDLDEIQNYAAARTSKGAKAAPRKLQPVFPVLAIALIAGGGAALLLPMQFQLSSSPDILSDAPREVQEPLNPAQGGTVTEEPTPIRLPRARPTPQREETLESPALAPAPTGVVRVRLLTWANVSVNGEDRGRQNRFFVDTLVAGATHTLRFTRDGYEDYEERITVARDQTTELEVRMRPRND